jgi:hypothetical protein
MDVECNTHAKDEKYVEAESKVLLEGTKIGV